MAKTYSFGENKKEFNSKTNQEVDVWLSPNYLEAKKKAIELLESGLYKGIVESDFWILKNLTKSGKMAYTGLIISHNGCLKINDCLPEEKRYKPECMTVDKEGYNGSLVFSYCNEAQGVYEVGEVSKANCTNSYPYAMALKRCMDRVILKNSKLAYAGIYSDSEAEEFINEERKPVKAKATKEETPTKETTVKEDPKEEPEASLEPHYWRKELVAWCNKKKFRIQDACTIHKLNNDSTEEEFKTALETLKRTFGK